jgi:hypothetical protein
MFDIRQRFSALRLVCLLSVFTVGMLSCTDVSPGEEPETAAAASEVVITADSIAKLAPGEKLIVDRSSDTAYTFDFAAAPIDFSRIAIRTGDGREVAMDRWLSSSEHGAKLLAAPNRAFRLAGKKQSLQGLPSLTERNVKLLQQNVWVCRYLYIFITAEICDAYGCYTVTIEYLEIECGDDGTEP